MLSSHWSCIIAYFTQTRPPIHSIVIAFLLSTLWLPRLVPAYVVFGNTQRNVTAPTVDYFQQRVKPYDRYGPMVLPAFSANEQCVFKSPSPNPLVANTLAKSGFSTVLAINWTNAMDFGCRNYAHAVHALEMTEDAYQQSGFPSPFTILLMIPVFLPGPFGGPLTDRYIAHDPHVGNEFPTTNVALMNINDYAQFLRNKTDTTSTQYVRIVHEQGSWNSVFLSNEYVGFNWALFSINAIVSVYGLFIFATTLFLRKFAADIRNVVFILGFLAVIANTVAMAHRYANYTRMTLEQVSSCLSCIAFYMLLYLWSSLLSQIKRDRSMYPLRCFLIFGALVALWTAVNTLIWLNYWDTSNIESIIRVNRYLTPITQLLVALLFCLVGYRFRTRRNQCRMSQETQQALTKLAWLSVMGFITFLLQAIANFISGPIDNLTSVSVAVINYTFLTMAFTIRSVAIIMILGVRVPKHLREAGGTSGIVSSTGEPANNHSFADTEGKRYGAETLQAKMFFIQTYSPTYSPAYYHHNEAQRFSVNLAPDPLDNQYQHH